MTDWRDELNDEERENWEQFVTNVRTDTVKKMEGSAFVLSLVPSGEADVKFAVELGLAIMLDKPILAVVMPGAKVSEHLRRVADEIVVCDIDVEAGRVALAEAMRRLVP